MEWQSIVAHTQTKVDLITHNLRPGQIYFHLTLSSDTLCWLTLYQGKRWLTILISAPADHAILPFIGIISFSKSPFSLDKTGFDTLRSLLSGCPYSRFNAPRDQFGLISSSLFYILELHTYSELNTLGLTPDLFGFIDCIYYASYHRFGAMNLYQLMYLWLNPWWVYTRRTATG